MIDQINKVLFRIGVCCGLLFVSLGIYAQPPSINSSVDRNNILIGEPVLYKVEVLLPSSAVRLKWFNIPDSIEHFEVVERSKIDSSDPNGSVRISQVITLTSFDSGRNVIPVFGIDVYPGQGDNTIHLFTDSIPIDVTYSLLDSTKTFHDIKSIIEVSDKWPWWMWAALALSAILVAGLIIYLLKQYRKKKQERALFNSKLSPYDEAILALQELGKQQLLMKGEANGYHTRLSWIFRRYATRKLMQNMMTMTSAEVLVALSSPLTSEYTSALAGCLRMGDAVKFAKYIPPVTESEGAMSQLKSVLEKMNLTDNAQNQTN